MIVPNDFTSPSGQILVWGHTLIYVAFYFSIGRCEFDPVGGDLANRS